MIFVDPCKHNGWKLRGICVANCHMWTDGDVEELHVFAESIGMKRTWVQVSKGVQFAGLVHYDLTVSRRRIAIARGARAVSAREAVEKWRKILEKQPAAGPVPDGAPS